MLRCCLAAPPPYSSRESVVASRFCSTPPRCAVPILDPEEVGGRMWSNIIDMQETAINTRTACTVLTGCRCRSPADRRKRFCPRRSLKARLQGNRYKRQIVSRVPLRIVCAYGAHGLLDIFCGELQFVSLFVYLLLICVSLPPAASSLVIVLLELCKYPHANWNYESTSSCTVCKHSFLWQRGIVRFIFYLINLRAVTDP